MLMHKSRILLTGGTGFFGRSLLRYLLTSGSVSHITVYVLTRNPSLFSSRYPHLASASHIRLLEGDIENRNSLPWSMNFTHVLHAATDSTIGPRLSPLNRFNQIVLGTTNVLDLAVQSGATRFLLTSSGGVYGRRPLTSEAIPEDCVEAPALDVPSTSYSQGKRTAEHLCALYRDLYDLHTVVARCFSFVGRDLPLDAHFAIGNFIHDALYSPSILIKSDGTSLRTYLDQRDLAYWLWTLLLQGTPGQTYNVGSDYVISIADLAHLVRDLVSPAKPVKFLSTKSVISEPSSYIPSIDKIYIQHGLRPTITLDNSIIYAASKLSFSNTRTLPTPQHVD